LGSAALDLAYTACGRFDGYYETQINVWDVAAGILIVREAGGQVSDFKGAWNPVFSTHILATNPKLYPQIMNLIKQVDMI
jgi:myo-inositol-1(or 4)-monophosphatase